MPLSEEELRELEAYEPPAPTKLQSWLGRKSFLGRLGETLSRPTTFAGSVLSSLPKVWRGAAAEAGEQVKEGIKGLPGLVTGAADIVGERFGAPSLQDYVDKKVGFDPDKDVVTGQKVLKEYGLIKKDDNPLLSAPGAAGLAADVLMDPLHIGAVAKAVGKPLKAAGSLASELVPKGFKRGPIEAASAAAERVKSVIQKEGLTEEALRRKLLDAAEAGEDTTVLQRELDNLATKYGAPGAQRESMLRKSEEAMGQNIGTGSLQITPENERFFQGIVQDPEQYSKFINELQSTLADLGKPPLNIVSDHPNRLKHALDQSGLRPEQINRILKNVTGVDNVISTDPITQARMRMFQHAHAQGLNKFSSDLLTSNTAYTQPFSPTGLHPTGKPDVEAFYVDAATRRYVVNGLTHNGAPLVFPNIDDAVRAQQVFQYMRPDTVGKVTIGEKMLDVYDEINRLYRYGVTQPFPQYAIMNKMTNRMNANIAGDVPVVGKHYDVANRIMGGSGYDETFDIGGQQFTGRQLVELYQRHGPALPNINPAIGRALEQSHERGGVLGKTMDAMQTVGRPFERASAGFVGTLTSPTGLGPVAARGQVNNQMLEEADRFGIFLHSLMNGLDAGSAMRKADTVLGNQSQAALTPLERQWANRSMLFYNYMRNTIPIMAKAFTEKPGTFNAVLKVDRQRKEQEPGYIREGISVDLPGPGTTLTNLPNPIENVTRQFGAANPMSLLAPLPKAVYEYTSGQSTLTGRPLTSKAPNYLPESMTVEGQTALPGLTQMGFKPETQNQILGNLPISRGLSIANYAKKPETQLSDFMLNVPTGLKVQRFEPKSTSMYAEAEAYEELLKQYASRGVVKRNQFGYELVPAMLPTLSPEEIKEVTNAYGMYSKLRKTASKVKKASAPKP